ncbi:MAG: lipopolysaccharide heptosyltransferase I [Desulfobacterales bacterium]|nr:lipopolysaccharide heptosyltransferase I [Desulfobacterales bacterium]
MANSSQLNILIVKLSAIGDVIHTLPALNAIRSCYPHAKITWLVEKDASDFVKDHPAIDRVIISNRKRWLKTFFTESRHKNIAEIRCFIKELRDTYYDLIIAFQSLLKSGILIGLTRGKRKIGFGRGMDHMEYSYFFLNERIPPVSMEHHALSRGLMLLDSIGIHSSEIVYHIPIKDQDRKTANYLIEQHQLKGFKPLVAINPGAKWETKLWDRQKFAELADALIEKYQVHLIFTGSKADHEAIEDILSRMHGTAVNLAGKTSLLTLAAVYEKTDFIISTDTGPMHVAAALGKPVVALFGPTAPWRTGPFGPGHQIIRSQIKCSPCFKRKCETHECMQQISVQDVLEGISNLGIF